MGKVRDNYEYIAWIDLETTGSSVNVDEILEVGLVITTRDLKKISEHSWLVVPQAAGKLLEMDPVVIDMHTTSGLLADVLKARQKESPNYSIRLVDEHVSKALEPYLTKGRISLAGSGVSHFDRQFIKRFMPLTSGILTYWAYDVGVIRRTLRLAGFPIPDEPTKPLRHRALDDALDHLEEFTGYMAWLKVYGLDAAAVRAGEELGAWKRE